ncbi:MAG TPA: glutamate-1-semialdehyde 2,1-aminomutase [Candidatus Thermoplasmatota archaeon]|nr:glutamate-1-semialdehyde 2,1-aminomutase [Candidatus Thermoplasmatota archaeon]
MSGAGNRALHAEAAALMPGGVSSPVRALKAVGGDPFALVAGQGAWVTDADGRRYVDLQMAFGPLLVGHAHPAVVHAVQQAAAAGLHFGALHPDEVALAREVARRHPAVERLRFVSSGTEAVMSAARLARAATGRDVLVKFEGGYHGHADPFLAKAGSGLKTLGLASSAGVPAATAALTATLPLDDEAALEAFFARHGDQVAAAVVEGVPANEGLLPQRPQWHRLLRRLTRQHGALLVVDEVITGFRLAPGGATEALGLEPDLVTLGKVLGGGLPMGAYGGRGDLMALVAPEGPVYQAGTLSGSPLAMAAGLATLRAFDAAPAGHAALAGATRDLAERLLDAAARRGVPFSAPHLGSLLWLVPEAGLAPRRAAPLPPAALARYAALHQLLRREGVHLPPSPYEVAFLSTAHDEGAAAHVESAFAAALGRLPA